MAIVKPGQQEAEAEEMAQGFVLSCQARPMTDKLTVSYDER